MKNLGLLIAAIFVLVFIFSESGCNIHAGTKERYKVPEQLGYGLKTGDANQVNINKALPEDATKAIEKGKFNEIHSILIYKGEKINIYGANCLGGQTIIVFPKLDIAVVFMGRDYNKIQAYSKL